METLAIIFGVGIVAAVFWRAFWGVHFLPSKTPKGAKRNSIIGFITGILLAIGLVWYVSNTRQVEPSGWSITGISQRYWHGDTEAEREQEAQVLLAEIENHMEKKEFEKMIPLADKLLKYDENIECVLGGYGYKAIAYMGLKQNKRALRNVKRGVRRTPADLKDYLFAFRFFEAKIRLKQGRYAKARKIAKKLMRLEPNGPDSYEIMALATDGLFDRRLDRHKSIGYRILALPFPMFFSRDKDKENQDRKDIIHAYQRAIDKGSNNPNVFYNLVERLEEVDPENSDIEKHLKVYVNEKPDDSKGYLKLANYYQRVGESASHICDTYDRAFELYNQDEEQDQNIKTAFEDAKSDYAYLKSILDLGEHWKSPDLSYQAAMIAFDDLRGFKLSDRYLGRAIHLDSTHVKSYVARGDIAIERGEMNSRREEGLHFIDKHVKKGTWEAIYFYKKATQIDPTYNLAWDRLVDAYNGLFKYGMAVDARRDQIAAYNELADEYDDPSYHEKAIALSDSLVMLRQGYKSRELAIQDYEKMIGLDSNNVEAWRSLTDHYFGVLQLKKVEETSALALATLNLPPDSEDARYFKFYTYIRLVVLLFVVIGFVMRELFFKRNSVKSRLANWLHTNDYFWASFFLRKFSILGLMLIFSILVNVSVFVSMIYELEEDFVETLILWLFIPAIIIKVIFIIRTGIDDRKKEKIKMLPVNLGIK